MSSPPPSPTQPLFLYKLSPTIPHPHLIKILCGLRTTPKVHPDPSDSSFPFVELDLATKNAVQTFLKSTPGLFIPLPYPSAKSLTGKLALGHKMQITPLQDTFPVPYFLYGGLADVDNLMDVLGIEYEPFVTEASVKDGRVRWWKGKHQALIDGEDGEDKRVKGKMYVVKNKSEEDRLREHMGSHFEVAKCMIKFEGGGGYVYGLEGVTFRYCGPEEHLQDKMS